MPDIRKQFTEQRKATLNRKGKMIGHLYPKSKMGFEVRYCSHGRVWNVQVMELQREGGATGTVCHFGILNLVEIKTGRFSVHPEACLPATTTLKTLQRQQNRGP